MLILGIDPGSLHTGYGLVEKHGSSLVHVDAGRFSCPRGMELPQRLAFLVGRLEALIAGRRPDLAVLETPFHGMNARSLIVLAQARGALLATLAGREVEIREYSPAEVKSAVTGNGRADKDQVARMVRLLLAVRGDGWASDATDALALAICCAQRLRLDTLASAKTPARTSR
ncbi:MAG TPA: crossover junction endodeoxyribonuclease RuvC [Thermoanaerobaculia bacterium]|nr:crossover junction endodeoxyribonuclease RuvC [Thermoanaerobaculia bacterium]